MVQPSSALTNALRLSGSRLRNWLITLTGDPPRRSSPAVEVRHEDRPAAQPLPQIGDKTASRSGWTASGTRQRGSDGRGPGPRVGARRPRRCSVLHTPKRLFVGRPLRSDRLGETLLPKRLALPVFCSDPLSSVAYPTEPMRRVLGRGGLAVPTPPPGPGLGVAALLVIVVASYRQTCRAYPNGGGAYAVSRRNLGVRASLVAASALLVDYVLTVAVSVVAGVAAITSAFPALVPHAVALSLAFVVLLTVVNLRGVKDAGRAFAVPTYGFVAIIGVLLVVAGIRLAAGQTLTAESAGYNLLADHRTGGLFTVFLALRAVASGGTRLTGGGGVRAGGPTVSG